MTNHDTALKLAKQVMEKAYSPYSKFNVGAVILADDDKYYVGANVENAAYPQGQCAEASAIGNMISSGAKHIKSIWIMGAGEKLVTPCGGCRQRILEFAKKDAPIYICCPEKGLRMTTNLAELLPHSFGGEHL